ncbi:MAG: hypothetical protein A3F31_03995 [Candidatus Levybacteria bacterium RIFCSPHIGHO2_12_FULL_38_12]|nr:MAG: hypothetical protein A2770_02385 [Candidatus Levybacteria bacterium RIFCSPHIGHO2_01_FULL_38_12]OGH21927.1 MAG: hypothetical protein A3D75_00605 [Candidatus Levybacteria bacterium RIFCSPHIGHO2_02_FULL_37_18]OGH22859.1 MAG: hypothetical protein A3F31_03995 [Candidatus Levybacteria bacterium RIFCSPHIGHO2_12_FULL_38_12]OGH33584.1 MAG: hypothetical protein A3A47_01950 [Candidatus Levybacteria bacterium RIFCSPLOWO2_01_FULL_37_20]OGH44505.1 MAG: hypothetical protein A3J14_03640 [Candidatus Lev
MKLFAKFISYLFHPVLFFLIMPFFIVYRQTESGMYAIKWMVFSSVFILFGVMTILFETLKGDFSDFDISHKEQRVKFYMIIFVIGATYLFAALYFKGIFFPLSIISLGIVLGLIIFAFVSHYVKASIHVAVSSAFVATIALLYRNGSITEVGWIVPLVAWARITLKRHTFSEVFVGGVLGVAIAAITFILGKYIYSL